jgi:hypothetical protein
LGSAPLGCADGKIAAHGRQCRIDAAISAVPVLGWFGDVFWRANAKNIAVLRDHLDRKAAGATT